VASTPPELSTFLVLSRFWKHLGLRRSDLAELPDREVRDLVTIIEAIEREEALRERQRGASRGGIR
jgi:hypothetical protein